MRKISLGQTLIFIALAISITISGIGASRLLLAPIPLGEYRPIAAVLGAAFAIFVSAVAVHRLLMRRWPLPVGEIAPGSRDEVIYHLYVLFYLIFFYPVLLSRMMPVPLLRSLYLALGARLGPNTWGAAVILDPSMVQIGGDCILGLGSLIVPHLIEGSKLAHYPVRVGDRVTIGAHAVLLSGVTVGDGAIIATGSVVPKHTVIGPGEVWGGVPARRIRPAPPALALVSGEG